LLQYVNKQKNLIQQFPDDPQTYGVNPRNAIIIRDALWDSPELLQGFTATNPAGLPDEDMELAASWSRRVAGEFVIMRHLKKHSIFLLGEEQPTAFGVVGIISPIEEVIQAPLPVMVKAVLLPFGDKIIYDSLIIPYLVSFGGGIRKRFSHSLRTAQELGGIVTALNPEDEEKAATDAIIDGNRKILAAFRKELAKEGLSEKMQKEHHDNLEDFVNDCLSGSIPPRSLLNLQTDDLRRHFSALENRVNRVSFKRLVKFLLNSGRIGWDAAGDIEKFLKTR
jgi:hypothetical protein